MVIKGFKQFSGGMMTSVDQICFYTGSLGHKPHFCHGASHIHVFGRDLVYHRVAMIEENFFQGQGNSRTILIGKGFGNWAKVREIRNQPMSL